MRATTPRSPAASRRCAVGKQMQFFGARVNLAKALLYAINGGRDEITGEQVAPGLRRRSTATSSTTTTSWRSSTR